MDRPKTPVRWLGVALVASAAVAAAIAVGKQVRRVKAIHLREQKLDEALEETMDCSDPIAKY